MQDNLKEYEFSVTIYKKKNIRHDFKYSIANAAKPLIYFASLFAMQTMSYLKYSFCNTKLVSRVYCIIIICVVISLLIFLRPVSWRDTTSDIPLHMLTKIFGVLSLIEVVYFIFIVPFGNCELFEKLFNKLDDIDLHFGTSKIMFNKIRAVSVLLALLPVMLVSGTVWLRKFNIVNIGQHVLFFMIMLQGTIIVFFIFQIYSKQLMLNILLVKKLGGKLPSPKVCIYGYSQKSIFKLIYTDLKAIENKANKHVCWFELMQIYDEVADCICYFNQIYSGQIFIMFISWFLCTLLTICRSLSPSVKYSEVFLNDLFMYSSLYSRPIFLAKMCEIFIKEREKTLSILLHNLVYQIDEVYQEQIQAMVDLVESRSILVTGHIFTANVSTVLEFAGRSISYTVLMIQYFYLHVFDN